jgi:hypothetical protein
MKSVQSFALLVLGLCVITINAQEPPEILPGSVNDIMVTIITPATNTIWGIEDPQTDEDWQVYVDAAAQLVDAATRIKSGGAGPSDSSWAENPEWQRFADVLIESGLEIQEAAREGDLETLINVSNDKMYPPCEECHIMFHPGVQEQEIN